MNNTIKKIENKYQNVRVYQVNKDEDNNTTWVDEKYFFTKEEAFEAANLTPHDFENPHACSNSVEIVEFKLDLKMIIELTEKMIAENTDTEEEDIIEWVDEEIMADVEKFFDRDDVDTIYQQEIPAINETSQALLYEVRKNIDNIEGDLEDGWKIEIENKKNSYKYYDVKVIKGEKEVSIKLRISNHSYNPANNFGCEEFLSVEIANLNPVDFGGEKSIQFNADEKMEDIISAIREKINKILDQKYFSF